MSSNDEIRLKGFFDKLNRIKFEMDGLKVAFSDLSKATSATVSASITGSSITAHSSNPTIHFSKSSINLEELQDVEYASLGDLEFIQYDNANARWTNKTQYEAFPNPTFDSIQLNLSATPTPSEGMAYWNVNDKTWNIKTETETVIQVGQEQLLRGINNTGVTLNNGEIVFISGAASSRPEFTMANSDSWETSQKTIGIITSDIANGAMGYATTFGLVRDLNTTGLTAGNVLYLDTTDGQFTETPPTTPNFIVKIGYVVVVHGSDGVIFFAVDHNRNSDFFNGTFVESFDALVTSAAGTITLSLERQGGGTLTMRFSDLYSTLDTDPALTIALTAGTTAVPQANYIYIPQSTKVLTKSTTGWPTTFEHIRITKIFVQSAADVASHGALINQNWNDHAADNNAQGHLSHIGENLRLGPAKYFSGIGGVGVDDYLTVTNNNAHFKSSSGIISQLHKQTFAAFDQSTVGVVVHIVNDSVTAYLASENLDTDVTADSTGAAIGNNKYFNLTFWGVANKGGEYSPIMCNLPGGFYNGPDDAINDVSGYNDDSMPRAFDIDSSTGFLICRVTIQMKTAASWIVVNTKDLRKPTGIAGGGAGGAITEFPDTIFDIHNTIDVTKKIVFDAQNITTANTRTITMDDANVDLGLINDYLDQAVKTTSSPTFVSPIIGTSLLPDASGGATIGSGSLEFGDVFLADNKWIYFGSDQDIRMNFDGSNWLFQEGGTTKIAYISATDSFRFIDNVGAAFGSGNDAVLKHTGAHLVLTNTVGDFQINAVNVLMDGAGGDDERLRLPYLTGVPASVDNGSIWMEADGLHIYYAGAEKVVAGV